MCGFAGVMGTPRPRDVAREEVRRMARTLQHRGPDDEGDWTDPRGDLAFGFRRLAILDLTAEGHQPMTSAGGRYTLVFNGEIYNFQLLRAELESLGCAFRGHSDTEVLLAAFDTWGVGPTLPRLDGMFAIAVWDGRERELHLVRDRLGKKPLYYGWKGGQLLFGSELKALRAHPAFDGQVDRDALASYLRFCYVPSPRSIYTGISKLPPASWLTVRPGRPGETRPQPFWNAVEMARAGVRDPLVLSDEEAADHLERILGDAVRMRMVADVPVGAFLSGGIDSSIVVAVMKALGCRARTFTIGFTEGEYDESNFASAVARHLGCEHTELLVTPEEARSVIPRLPTLYDEPFADSSQVPTFLVSQLARRAVTVALSGDGGDELFGGYHRYLAGAKLASTLEAVPRVLRRGSARLLSKVPPASWDRAGRLLDRVLSSKRRGLLTGNRVHKLASVLETAGLDALYASLVSTWSDPTQLLLQGQEPAHVLPELGDLSFLSPTQKMMLIDLVSYLPDDILAKVDRASMGASLEVRAPFLAQTIVDFAWRLPVSQKIRAGQGKWLVRKVLDRHVPRKLVDRPKQGFAVPIDAWLRGPLRDWAETLLSEDRLRREGFFEPGRIREAWEQHLSGAANRQTQLWTVLMFQAWMEAQQGGQPGQPSKSR